MIFRKFYIGILLCSVGYISGFAQKLPIKKSRSISFFAEEGSYMNIDISPDGRFIVFDLVGDIYILPSKGGKARRLTKGVALHLRPSWSPDGKRIAYVSDSEDGIRFHFTDLRGRRDSIGAEASWGQDISWLQKLVHQGEEYEPIRFSNDLREGFYHRRGELHKYHFSEKKICKVSEFYRSGMEDWMTKCLSPDGHWMAYYLDTLGKKALVVRSLVSKKERILVPSILKAPKSFKPSVPDPRFCFTPDSKSILIGYGGKIHKIDVESARNEIIPFTANVKVDLGKLVHVKNKISNKPITIKHIRSVTKSPDGSLLAFCALNKIYLKNLKTGSLSRLVGTNENQFQPTFSPDGKWIAFVSWSDSLGGRLWKIRVDGGDPIPLTNLAGQYQRPCWSPDGKFIAVIRGINKLGDRDDEGRGMLLFYSSEGVLLKTVDSNLTMWNQLSFSRNGTKIYYQIKQEGFNMSKYKAFLMEKNLLTGSSREVVIFDKNDQFLQQRASSFQQRGISPDGRFLVYTAFERIYVVALRPNLEPYILNSKSPSTVEVARGLDPRWEEGGKVLSWIYANKYQSLRIEDLEAHKSIFEEKKILALKPKSTTIELNSPISYAKGTLVLKNARIITMDVNNDDVIERGTIVITNGRISNIYKTNPKIPKNVTVIDLEGKTIIPGIIDVHLHMRFPPNVFPQQSWMLLANLAYGVTTALDPALNYDSFGYSELVCTGQMTGPRFYSVGYAIGPIRTPFFNTYSEALDEVFGRKQMGAIMAKQYLLENRQKKQWLLQACQKYRLNMTNEGTSRPLEQLAMIKDGSTAVEHTPNWGDIYSDIIRFIGKSGTSLTPTLQVTSGMEPAKEYMKYKFWQTADDKMRRFIKADSSQIYPTANGAEYLNTILNSKPKDSSELGFRAAARMNVRFLRAGANIALGSHGNNQGIGVHNEMWTLSIGGATNMEILKVATINGAKALGLDDDIGSLKRGKIADLVILNANPLEDIHHTKSIGYVMKDGNLYDGENLNMIWPTKKKLAKINLDLQN